ncbi:dysbindin isoform X3 [Vombatus ursinus]|uniref:dysbindin isoform X3 n=1 Tax=Vombatus ursinus TaxID=29139 RepID=UPI000FFD675F|nr:dysbindin isoform X3 [Vombatus ursinus]
MLETLKERLLSVQQDFTSGLKSLSDKSREAKVKSKQRTVQSLPKFSAGLELLSRYEDTWAALHKRAKECASAGERVDTEVVMLSVHWEKKRTSLIELQEQLQQIPGLLADLESVTANLNDKTKALEVKQFSPGPINIQLEANFEEVENHLLHLEDLCGQYELERYKHLQTQQLENYKKNKRKELEAFKEPIGSMSSMEVNVDMLEQMDLMDMSDQEALDVFLNSGEDNLLSPGLGPDPSTCQNEISLEVPSLSASRSKPSFLSSVCTDSATQENSESGESPVVQSDEEEVQVDTALATIKASSDVSDESDS